jgi:arylsulfatase A-like enzyme
VLRTERHKYVHFAALPPLLFDLERDPEERVDRSRDPEYATVLLECAQRMLSWRMAHDDQTLTHMALTPDGVYERKGARWA